MLAKKYRISIKEFEHVFRFGRTFHSRNFYLKLFRWERPNSELIGKLHRIAPTNSPIPSSCSSITSPEPARESQSIQYLPSNTKHPTSKIKHLRCAVSVPKKIFRLSVTRNRVRRRAYSILALYYEKIEQEILSKKRDDSSSSGATARNTNTALILVTKAGFLSNDYSGLQKEVFHSLDKKLFY